jgi:hypothetical protein
MAEVGRPRRQESDVGAKSEKLSALFKTFGFKYDPFGRRIYKSSSSATSIYAYDGDNLIE